MDTDFHGYSTASNRICAHPFSSAVSKQTRLTDGKSACGTDGGPGRSVGPICIPRQCTCRICRALATDLLHCRGVCQPAAGRTRMSQRGQPNLGQFCVVCSGVVGTRVHLTPMWLIGTGKRMFRAVRREILRGPGVQSAVRSFGNAIIHHGHPFLVPIPSSCR